MPSRSGSGLRGCPAAAFLLRCCLCFALNCVAVAFGVYAFFGELSEFYLVHFGNAITILFMNEAGRRDPRRFLYPACSMAGYVAIRHLSSNWPRVALYGLMNVLEQTVGHLIMDASLPLRRRDVSQGMRFLQAIAIVGVVLPFACAVVAAGLAVVLVRGSTFGRVVLLYGFSRASGACVLFYAYYVFRDQGRPVPSRRYLADLIGVCAVTASLNCFSDYYIFREAAIILCFPLLVYVASRHHPPDAVVAYICVIAITFAAVALNRGPFVLRPEDSLRSVVGLYAILFCSALMTSLLSLVMEQRRRATGQIMQMKDDMFFVSSQVSHDVRGPISHILDVCESVVAGTYAAVEVDEVRYSCDTVTDLMDMWLVMLNETDRSAERNGLRKARSADIEKLLESVDVASFARRLQLYGTRNIRTSSKPLVLTVESPILAEGTVLQFDEKLLHHVIMNLITNAIKYSDRGRVRVVMSVDDEGIKLGVSVADEGIGIDARHLDKIFERFYRVSDAEGANRRPSGVSHGVGLNIVKTLIATMGGTVSVTSTPGEGSEFCVVVPCRVIERPERSSSSPDIEGGDESPDLSSLKILLAEDNETCLKMFTRHMIRECASVVAVTDGQSVLRSLRADVYDVLVLDGTLRDDIAGIDVLNEMRRDHDISTPAVVTISGGELSQSRDWGPLVIVHCPKPFTKAQLLRALAEVTRLKKKRDAENAVTTAEPHKKRRSSRTSTVDVPG